MSQSPKRRGRPRQCDWDANPPRVGEHGAESIDWDAYAEFAAPAFARLILCQREIQPSTAPEQDRVPTAPDLVLPAAESITIPASTGPSPDLPLGSGATKGAH